MFAISPILDDDDEVELEVPVSELVELLKEEEDVIDDEVSDVFRLELERLPFCAEDTEEEATKDMLSDVKLELDEVSLVCVLVLLLGEVEVSVSVFEAEAEDCEEKVEEDIDSDSDPVELTAIFEDDKDSSSWLADLDGGISVRLLSTPDGNEELLCKLSLSLKLPEY